MRDYDPRAYFRRYPQPHCVNRGIENVIVFPDNRAEEGEHAQRMRRQVHDRGQ